MWSIASRWVPWCLALILLLTLGWTGLVSWVEATQFDHVSDSQMAIAAVNKSAPAIPLIAALSILTVTLADLLRGGFVVTQRFLEERFLNPWLIKRKAQTRAEAERAERLNRHWRAWNQRRLEAEAKGEPFSEPTPDLDSIGNGPEYY